MEKLKIKNLAEEDINQLPSLLIKYLMKYEDTLSVKQGYTVGLLSSYLSYYGVLVNAEKRGLELKPDDKEIVLKVETLLDSLPDIETYLIEEWAGILESYRINNVEVYNNFINSRGKHAESYGKQNEF